uniref:CKLF like MARVEL transmembrane domain containing 2 n=1 Tax=Aotus nancymaae TaxID=37293 RepID=A0A2K5E8J6_AOTNA
KGDKPAPEPAPPPAKDKPGEDEKDDEAAAPKKSKSVQPKHEVSTRKGCRRYRWELKDSNKEFWLLGHAEVKILSTKPILYIKSRRSLHIILMSLAAFFAFIDVRLQRNHVRGKRVKSICWFLLQERKKDPRRARNQRPAKPPEAARPPEPAKGKK